MHEREVPTFVGGVGFRFGAFGVDGASPLAENLLEHGVLALSGQHQEVGLEVHQGVVHPVVEGVDPGHQRHLLGADRPGPVGIGHQREVTEHSFHSRTG